jgi:putative ABC transport system permease protein
MLEGEGFREGDVTANENPVVLSKRLADLLFPNQNPIGQRIRGKYDDPAEAWHTAFGVAADVKNGGLTAEEVPEIYNLRRDIPSDWDHGVWGKTSVVVVRSSLPPDQTSSWFRSQVSSLDPTCPSILQRCAKGSASLPTRSASRLC